jgi:hypothetical protein
MGAGIPHPRKDMIMNTRDMDELTGTEQAAERVAAFLRTRSAMIGHDPAVIYVLGGPDGLIELRTDDLVELVREVRPDAVVVDDAAAEQVQRIAERQAAARARATEARARQDGRR